MIMAPGISILLTSIKVQETEMKNINHNIFIILIVIIGLMVSACSTNSSVPTEVIQPTETLKTELPNPASVFCEDQGFKFVSRTNEDGSQTGYCVFPDGSECEEWAYFRGECVNLENKEETLVVENPTVLPTPIPVDLSDTKDWWTYTHPVYGFSILLPQDWEVEESTTGDDLMNGHLLWLKPKLVDGMEQIRMTFRRAGEETLLWPTGVGQGEFIPLGTLDIANEPAQRVLLVCPTGEVTAIWYHQAEGIPSITRGGMEFSFIFSFGGHCEEGKSLDGKIQRTGETIIASLQVP